MWRNSIKYSIFGFEKTNRNAENDNKIDFMSNLIMHGNSIMYMTSCRLIWWLKYVFEIFNIPLNAHWTYLNCLSVIWCANIHSSCYMRQSIWHLANIQVACPCIRFSLSPSGLSQSFHSFVSLSISKWRERKCDLFMSQNLFFSFHSLPLFRSFDRSP